MAISKTLNLYIIKRRLALFMSFLVSGGMMIFQAEPILIGMILLCFSILGWRLPTSSMRWPYILVLAVVLVTLLRPGGMNYLSLLSRCTYFLGAILLLQVYRLAPKGALALDLYVMLRWLAVQAILTVLLAKGVDSLFSTIISNESEYKTILLFFTYHNVSEIYTNFVRPDGFFFEPAVFQVYLNIFLFLAVFVFKDVRNAILALIAVLTTQSTTGLIILGILGLAAFIVFVSSTRGWRRTAVVAAALIFAPFFLSIGYDNLIDKLEGDAQGSAWSREYDFYTGIGVIEKYPLMGIGFDAKRYFEVSNKTAYTGTELVLDQTEERPTSNGLVQLFYVLGIPLGLFFFTGIFRQTLFPNRWLFGAILALSFFSEAIVFAPFFMAIIFSAFVPSEKKRDPAHRVTGVAGRAV